MKMKRKKMLSIFLGALVCIVATFSWMNSLAISDRYNLSVEEDYLKGLPEKVTVEELSSTLPQGAEVESCDGFVGTGTQVIISGKSYTVIVSGDVDGNGKVDSTDYLRIKQYCLGSFSFNDSLFSAADVDGSGKVDSTDYLRVKGHFLGAFNLFENSYLPEDAQLPEITVSSISAKAGDTVEITLNMANNPGVIGITLSLEYDDSVLTLTDISRGDALGEMEFTPSKNLISGCKLPWDAEQVKPEEATNGTMVTLKFKVAENAPVGSYSISLTNEDIIDNNLQPISVKITNGAITIE